MKQDNIERITYHKLEDGGEYLVESICVVIFYLFLENH